MSPHLEFTCSNWIIFTNISQPPNIGLSNCVPRTARTWFYSLDLNSNHDIWPCKILTGTARTSLVITIGPSPRHRGETTSTIMFGQRVGYGCLVFDRLITITLSVIYSISKILISKTFYPSGYEGGKYGEDKRRI